MSKTGASPEFERKMQEIAEKTAHMVIPRSKVQAPLTEPRFPAWTEDTEPSPMIPAEAVTIYSCDTHRYLTRVKDELVQHIDRHAGCRWHVDTKARK